MKNGFALAMLAAICFFTFAAPQTAGAEASYPPLPIDASAGPVPLEDCFTADGYEDATLSVQMRTEERHDATFRLAYVKVADASQLRTGLAGDFTPKNKRSNKTSAIAASYNAVVAISGDNYITRDVGLIIRQGVTLREKESKSLDALLIDANGNFHIVPCRDREMIEAYVNGMFDIVQAFSFGPALVIDGEVQPIPKNYQFAPHYLNPRAAIGQIAPLSYLLVVVDGRTEESSGVTLETLAEVMHDLGCQQAFNLDGGNTATMMFHGDYYSDKIAANERSIGDIVYFATGVTGAGE